MKQVVRIFAVAIVTLLAMPVYSVGMSAVKVHSYIGQPLHLTIPIFNVADPEAVSVTLSESSLALNNSDSPKALISKANSQLAISVTTEQAVTEPYLEFSIEIRDSETVITKSFTVLLDVAQQAPDPMKVSPALSASEGSILGPYSWAAAGNIPEKFGPVVDGQSLWRVARRINKAMGVSVDQMMWALHQANPDAFATGSINSLRAGEMLSIPPLSVVNQVSDQQAKQMLANSSSNSIQPTLSLKPTPAKTDEAQSESKPLTEVAFQVSGLESIDENQNTGAATHNSHNDASHNGSQAIISSLAETVGNLTQELIRKDKQIQFLEERIVALEGIDGLAASSSFKAALASEQVLEQTNNVDEAKSPAVEVIAPIETVDEDKGWSWFWWPISLLILLAVGYLNRVKLSTLMTDLNFFGRNENLTFEADRTSEEAAADQISKQQQSETESSADLSLTEVVKKAMHEDVSYLSFDSIDDEPVFIKKMKKGLPLGEESEPDFEQRFMMLIDEKRFDDAREILDLAKKGVINIERYHCERLRLYQEMRDEDAFYSYYYEIEHKISDFSEHSQAWISHMVVQLGQSQPPASE